MMEAISRGSNWRVVINEMMAPLETPMISCKWDNLGNRME